MDVVGQADDSLRVLMLPWLAHGHISPFLELAKSLSHRRRFHVYFCSTPINLSSIQEQLQDHQKTTSFDHDHAIQVVALHLPTLPDLPPHYHTTKHLPTCLMPTLKTAFDLARPSFAEILQALRPDVLVYDFIQPWAAAEASLQNIPSLLFLPTAAISASFLSHLLLKGPDAEFFPAPSLRLEEHEVAEHARLLGSVANGLSDGERLLRCLDHSSPFVLIKTCREIESKYIDYISSLTGKESVPVGPLVPADTSPEHDPRCDQFREWLSKKKESSVVFVSFGSECFMSKDEMEEMADDLELSGVSFIWVVRFLPEGEEMGVESVLPGGFLERAVGGGMGMVVEGWAPQRMILSHPSIGGFVTHCGWSSVMEALMLGVPMVAVPLHLDQPLNAKLVVELGAGVEIIRRSDATADQQRRLFAKGELARGIRKVVVEEEGDGVRKKAKEMGQMLSKKRDKDEDMDAVVEKIVRCCAVRRRK